MNELAEELFNILKGANYKLRLFTAEGIKTLQPEEATRFYAYDQDLMVTLRKEDAKTEILVQAGQEYDIPGNRRLLDSIKSVAHKNLGEYTVKSSIKKLRQRTSHTRVSYKKASANHLVALKQVTLKCLKHD